VAELLEALAKMGGSAVIGADHGNCEQMWDYEHNMPHTSHTLNLVEFFVVGRWFSPEVKPKCARSVDSPTWRRRCSRDGHAATAEMTGSVCLCANCQTPRAIANIVLVGLALVATPSRISTSTNWRVSHA